MIRAYKSGGTLYDTLICCKNRFKMVCWFSLVSQPGQTVLLFGFRRIFVTFWKHLLHIHCSYIVWWWQKFYFWENNH